jgi:hypothetical protein
MNSMNRKPVTGLLNTISHYDLKRETAIHEAGHAAAIYLGNKQRQLPPVFFQIFIKPQALTNISGISGEWVAKVDGGRLIHTLPSTIYEATRDFSEAQKQAYQLAFEADIVNLLVGPLAEAKYVALRDEEPLNPRLISLNALQYYGGSSDIDIVREYLDCFISDKEQHAAKLTELFLMAFSFIHDHANWQAIMTLADYLLSVGKDWVDCEEAGAVINSRYSF